MYSYRKNGNLNLMCFFLVEISETEFSGTPINTQYTILSLIILLITYMCADGGHYSPPALKSLRTTKQTGSMHEHTVHVKKKGSVCVVTSKKVAVIFL